jgi:hypothetical protein
MPNLCNLGQLVPSTAAALHMTLLVDGRIKGPVLRGDAGVNRAEGRLMERKRLIRHSFMRARQKYFPIALELNGLKQKSCPLNANE